MDDAKVYTWTVDRRLGTGIRVLGYDYFPLEVLNRIRPPRAIE